MFAPVYRVNHLIYFKTLRTKLTNYLLFKIVFIGAVLEPELQEFVVWVFWLSIGGFLKMLAVLTAGRFEYVRWISSSTFLVVTRVVLLRYLATP